MLLASKIVREIRIHVQWYQTIFNKKKQLSIETAPVDHEPKQYITRLCLPKYRGSSAQSAKKKHVRLCISFSFHLNKISN